MNGNFYRVEELPYSYFFDSSIPTRVGIYVFRISSDYIITVRYAQSKKKKKYVKLNRCAHVHANLRVWFWCMVYTTMIIESGSGRSFNHQSTCAVRHTLSLKTVLLNAVLVKFRISVSFYNTREHYRRTRARYVSLVYSAIINIEFFFSISTPLFTHIFNILSHAIRRTVD